MKKGSLHGPWNLDFVCANISTYHKKIESVFFSVINLKNKEQRTVETRKHSCPQTTCSASSSIYIFLERAMLIIVLYYH
jgi:hypothetical protein